MHRHVAPHDGPRFPRGGIGRQHLAEVNPLLTVPEEDLWNVRESTPSVAPKEEIVILASHCGNIVTALLEPLASAAPRGWARRNLSEDVRRSPRGSPGKDDRLWPFLRCRIRASENPRGRSRERRRGRRPGVPTARVRDVISVHPGEVVASRVDRLVQSSRQTQRAAVRVNPEPIVFEAPRALERIVRRTVVDDHEVPVLNSLTDDRADRGAHRRSAIPDRHRDAEVLIRHRCLPRDTSGADQM